LIVPSEREAILKSKLFMALSGVGNALGMIPCLHAHADFQGLSVASSLGAPLGRITYRVYANFDDPLDNLNTVYGSPTVGAMRIQSRNLTDTGLGSSFFNPVTSHGNAPTPQDVHTSLFGSSIPPITNAAWDTFYTIGVGAGQYGTGPNGADETASSPGFPANWPNSNPYSESNGGWLTAGPTEQGNAGWLGDGDPQLRVLIMQLTVSSTSGVRGTVNLAGIFHNGLAGGTGYVIAQQTFNAIPAPPSLALIALPVMFSRFRRCRVPLK
jgi:hypothetical protein